MMSFAIPDKTVLVTGANRGLGRALVDEALRALLAGRGVSVYAVMPGPIDTDMVRDLDVPKTPAGRVALATLDGVERGEQEIFPDPMSQSVADGWRVGVAKRLERQNAELVAAEPIAA